MRKVISAKPSMGFLLNEDFLHDDGRVYSMSLEAEKAFGRKNFMEIYSVFSSPLEFEVVALSGDIIGTVQWYFFEKLLEESSAFYLAGSAWLIQRIEWKKKCVRVLPATAGKATHLRRDSLNIQAFGIPLFDGVLQIGRHTNV